MNQSLLPIHDDFRELIRRTYYTFEEQRSLWAQQVRLRETGRAYVRLVDDPNVYDVEVQRYAPGYLEWDLDRLALALGLATPMTGRLKARQDRSEFGGEDSYLLKVRRIGRDHPCGDDVRDGDFGIYLGRHDGGYFVALQAIFPADIIGCKRFRTQVELKAHWELD